MRSQIVQVVLALALLATPSLKTQSAIPESTSSTGLEGVISEGPLGGPANRSRPLADVEFLITTGNESRASIKTDTEGRFHVLLAPGHYTLSRKTGEHPCSFEVDVTEGQMKRVEWTCGTGMM